MKQHAYRVAVEWTGNEGTGTSSYKTYRRDHTIESEGKPPIAGSSDPAFRGDPMRYSPEDLLVASLSACHMLWYLHLCAANKIAVFGYTDTAEGLMEERADGSGVFVRVTLRPSVKIRPGDDRYRAMLLHHEAHRMCFIANSVNFPVELEGAIVEHG